MIKYHNLINKILHTGYNHYDDSRQENTRAIFGYQDRFGLGLGFPAVTQKKLAFKSVATELLWFLRGGCDITYLKNHNVGIWDKDAYNYFKRKGGRLSYHEFVEAVKDGRLKGHLGPVYGKQWRNWVGADHIEEDQIKNLFNSLKDNPRDRGHIVLAWNPADIKYMALRPCHCLVQFNVREEYGMKWLDCQWYQRSADVFLGIPFNIASYALLTNLLAKALGYIPGDLIMTLGNAHIYEPHNEAVKTMMLNDPTKYGEPTLGGLWRKKIQKTDDFTEFNKMVENLEPEDFELINYKYYPPIKAEMIAPIE